MALAQDGSLPSNWTRFSDLIPSTEDRDMDGMPDDWEESLGLDPDNPDDAWEDTDGDGMVNLHEYFSATDPGDAADRLSIESIQSSGGGQSVILLSNPARIDLRCGTCDVDAGTRLGGSRPHHGCQPKPVLPMDLACTRTASWVLPHTAHYPIRNSPRRSPGQMQQWPFSRIGSSSGSPPWQA